MQSFFQREILAAASTKRKQNSFNYEQILSTHKLLLKSLQNSFQYNPIFLCLLIIP